MQAKLSVIMPAYNHEKFVGEAIEGVLNQTFTDFEFIIIDDGSQQREQSISNSSALFLSPVRIAYHPGLL